MNFKKPLFMLLSLVLAVYSLSGFAKGQELPDISDDGLHLVKDSKMAIVYVEPGADLSVYSYVMLKTPEVAFKKNWERDQSHGSASKLSTSSRVNTKGIKKDLAEAFDLVFAETLKAGGYKIVDEGGAEVLVISPSIVNLDVTAPATHGSGRTNVKVRSAGEMTLYIELYDSETGDLIAKAVDRGIDNANNQGFYTWATPASNKQAANRILKGWADILVNALNEAKSSSVVPVSK
jgi:hypothetical protein